MIKIYNEEDYKGLRIAGKLAAQTLDYITDYVKEGISTLALNDLCDEFIRANGGISACIGYRGYLYCDWNVSSGDAGGTKTTSGVVNNVISGIKKHNVSIVLQHDITSYSVDAVEQILFWGIQNGYTFMPMSETTPLVQFKPQN